MKKLFLFLALTSIVFGQGKYLQNADSILVVSSSGKYFIVQVEDSADTYIDTVEVRIYSMLTKSYTPIGLQDLYAGEYTDLIIPGDGNTRRYLVNEPYPTQVQIVRKNKQYITRRTFVWVIPKYGY